MINYFAEIVQEKQKDLISRKFDDLYMFLFVNYNYFERDITIKKQIKNNYSVLEIKFDEIELKMIFSNSNYKIVLKSEDYSLVKKTEMGLKKIMQHILISEEEKTLSKFILEHGLIAGTKKTLSIINQLSIDIEKIKNHIRTRMIYTEENYRGKI